MGRGFSRHDFTGGAGPGLRKLRSANLGSEIGLLGVRAPSAGLAELKQMMKAGHWADAILCAAKWPDLGDEAAAIHRGREALLRPAFQRQLKRDPAAMIEEAKAALVRRYA